jgi:hypothetical protein
MVAPGAPSADATGAKVTAAARAVAMAIGLITPSAPMTEPLSTPPGDIRTSPADVWPSSRLTL